jgi:hypothetical protein
MSIHSFHDNAPAALPVKSTNSLFQSLSLGLIEVAETIPDAAAPLPVVEGSLSGLGNHSIDITHIPSAWV